MNNISKSGKTEQLTPPNSKYKGKMLQSAKSPKKRSSPSSSEHTQKSQQRKINSGSKDSLKLTSYDAVRQILDKFHPINLSPDQPNLSQNYPGGFPQVANDLLQLGEYINNHDITNLDIELVREINKILSDIMNHQYDDNSFIKNDKAKAVLVDAIWLSHQMRNKGLLLENAEKDILYSASLANEVSGILYGNTNKALFPVEKKGAMEALLDNNYYSISKLWQESSIINAMDKKEKDALNKNIKSHTLPNQEIRQILPKSKTEGTLSSSKKSKEPDYEIETTFGNFQLSNDIIDSNLRAPLRIVMTEKIKAGELLYQEIMHGEKQEVEPSLQDISNLMWFLQAKAENLQEPGKKIGSFSSGAFNIEDPQEYLRKYLDHSAEVYQRKSSHIKAFQKIEGGVARGIDFNGNNIDELLPYGKITIIYSPMLKCSKLINENRLLVKMETYGCAFTPFQDRPDGPPSRKIKILHDAWNTILHGLDFVRSLLRKCIPGAQTKEGMRKEHIPDDIKNEYNTLISEFKEKGQTSVANRLSETKLAGEFKDIDHLIHRLRNNPLSGSCGIHIMYERVAQVLNDNTVSNTHVKNKLKEFKQNLENRYSIESLGARIGNEAVLNIKDLIPQEIHPKEDILSI